MWGQYNFYPMELAFETRPGDRSLGNRNKDEENERGMERKEIAKMRHLMERR